MSDERHYMAKQINKPKQDKDRDPHQTNHNQTVRSQRARETLEGIKKAAICPVQAGLNKINS